MGKSKNIFRHKWQDSKDKRYKVCLKCGIQKWVSEIFKTHYYNQKGEQIGVKAPECLK